MADSTADEETEFTSEERAAMMERAKELRSRKGGKTGKGKKDGITDLLEKIAEMPADERELATSVHETVMAAAPELEPKTWYGQPAYAKNGKVVCFFQAASKFGTRYATFGFQETAQLDDGDLWPTSYAVVGWSPAVEETISDLVRRAVG
ncbi:MAG: hypothetical protein JWP66_712 [Naasia sp.]|nr:hypothetical protein [Naasia sp.]